MRIVHTAAEATAIISEAKSRGKTTGFVPTMGAFHAGHLALMKQARQECDLVAVSIFVNPAQFGPSEDLDSYPRNLQADTDKAAAEGVDLVFAPAVNEIYPEGFNTYIEVGGLTEKLEGASRPGHFRGVATVVAKLLNIIPADKAYFGMKDFQQLQVIRKMVRDLNFRIEVVPVATVREADGLAMSSRNAYLSTDERASATILYKAIKHAESVVTSGERDARAVQASVIHLIEAEPDAVMDYAAVVHPETFEPVGTLDGPALLALAVRIGRTRLIDNTLLETDHGG